MFAQFLLCCITSIFVVIPFFYWNMDMKYTKIEVILAKILIVIFLCDVVYVLVNYENI